MWCVASAPIVPLARDLDAALGTPRGELAVHFRKLSTPLPTTPLPSRAAPAFLPHTAHATPHCPTPLSGTPAFLPHTAHATPHHPTPLSGCTRVSSTHRPRRSDSRGLVSRLPAPAPRPAPQPPTPSAPPSQRWGPSSENTKKRAPFLGERCSFWVLSGRKRPVILMFQKPQPKKTERTSCAKRMRMNMARG